MTENTQKLKKGEKQKQKERNKDGQTAKHMQTMEGK